MLLWLPLLLLLFLSRATSSSKQCPPGHHLLPDYSCSACPPPCSSCLSPSFCFSCMPGFQLHATLCRCLSLTGLTLNHTCLPCRDPDCLHCFEDYRTCSHCRRGYGVTPMEGLCQPCIKTNCLECIVTYDCSQCMDGYGVDGQPNDGGCLPCLDAACRKCGYDFTTCLQCVQGYGVSNNRTCRICEGECRRCTQVSTCVECKPGYALREGRCSLPCVDARCRLCLGGSGCGECIGGYGYDPGLSQCVPCQDVLCLDCRYDYQQCLQCDPTFITIGVLESRCRPCSDPNCLHCSPSNASLCLLCRNGFFLQSGWCNWGTSLGGCQQLRTRHPKCSICSPNTGIIWPSGYCLPCKQWLCAQCPHNTYTCTLCRDGYGLLGSGYCYPCSSSLCLLCASNATLCTKCVAGYAPNLLGQCLRCAANIPRCVLCGSAWVCLACESGYGLWGGVCAGCRVSGCVKCGGDAGRCQQCGGVGLGLTATNTCLPCTVEYCTNCSLNNTICRACTAGYGIITLDTGTRCMPCNASNCLQCPYNATLCSKCGSLTGVNNGTCSPCPNCTLCPYNHLICTACISKFGPYQGRCLPCSSYDPLCLQCPNLLLQCGLCVRGYGVGADHRCIACYLVVDECRQCAANASVCTSCAVGYGVQSGRCIGCSDSRCQVCSADIAVCTNCSLGHGPDPSGACVPCLDTLCSMCSTDYSTCLQCRPGHGPAPAGCTPCTKIKCLACPAKPTICTLCEGGFGVRGRSCSFCQDEHCGHCADDYRKCERCLGGYGMDGGTCVGCYEGKCVACFGGPGLCTECELGFGVSYNTNGDSNSSSGSNSSAAYSYSCVVCSTAQCLNCSSNYQQCLECILGYGLNHNNQCLLCNDAQCQKCSFNYMICLQCQPGYGLSDSVCQPCALSLCGNCSLDVFDCHGCLDGYGMQRSDYNYTPVCVPCVSSLCRQCPTDPTNCTSCSPGYGVSGSTCTPCLRTNCLLCPQNASLCSLCSPRFMAASGRCLRCTHPQCQACSTILGTCLKCVQSGLYGLHQGTCLPCVETCLTCSGLNYSLCLSCYSGHYLANGVCMPCQDHCVLCMRYGQCLRCGGGYYLVSGLYCRSCPYRCVTCVMGEGADSQWMQCRTCQLYYELINDSNNSRYNSNIANNTNQPVRCQQICGDRVAFQLACDNKLGLPLDGCDQQCKVMPGFICTVNSTSRGTVCSYYLPITLQIIGVKVLQTGSAFSMGLGLVPALDVFRFVTEAQWKLMLAIAGMMVDAVSYDSNTSTLYMLVYYNTLEQSTMNLVIDFRRSGRQEFEHTPSAQTTLETTQLIRQNKIDEVFGNMRVRQVVNSNVYASVGIGWLIPILTFLLRQKGGLEATLCLQIGHLSMKETNIMPEQIKSLDIIDGLNVHFKTQQTQKIENSTFVFYHNFNGAFVLFLLPLLLYLICRYRLHRFKKRNPNLIVQPFQLEEQQKILKQVRALGKYYVHSLNLLLQCCLFNLNSFVDNTTKFILQYQATDYLSIVLIAVTLLIYFWVLLKFYFHCRHFTSFCQPFLSLYDSYVDVYWRSFMVVVPCYILVAKPSAIALAIVPYLMLLAYTIILRPYVRRGENFKSAFNLVVMIGFIGLRVLQAYGGQSRKNVEITYVYFFVMVAVLMPLTQLLTLCFMLCYLYDEKVVKPRDVQNYQALKQLQENDKIYSILMELGIIAQVRSLQDMTNAEISDLFAEMKSKLVQTSKEEDSSKPILILMRHKKKLALFESSHEESTLNDGSLEDTRPLNIKTEKVVKVGQGKSSRRAKVDKKKEIYTFQAPSEQELSLTPTKMDLRAGRKKAKTQKKMEENDDYLYIAAERVKK